MREIAQFSTCFKRNYIANWVKFVQIQVKVVFLPVTRHHSHMPILWYQICRTLNKPTSNFAVGSQETSVLYESYVLSVRFLFFSAK